MMKKFLSALMALTLIFSICSPVFSVYAKDAVPKDTKKTAMYLPENIRKHETNKITASRTNAQPQSEYILVTGPFSSDHPYISNTYDIWKYENPDANVNYLEITFSAETKTEKDCDFISIFDSSQDIIGSYSGDQLAGKTIKVLGNCFYLVLDPDKYVNDYGFDVTSVNGVSSPSVSGTCGVNLNWTFTFDTGMIDITGTGDMDNFDYDFDTYDCNTPWRWLNSLITGVSMGSGVASIGNFAFSDCYALSSVTIGPDVTTIGEYAFAWCDRLVLVNIPGASIGNYAFVECRRLASLTIGDGVKTIGDFAFTECNRLISVEIPAGVTGIGDGVFAFCSALTAINVDDSNSKYLDLDGVLFSKDMTILVQYPIGFAEEYDSYYTIPDDVTCIGDYAFAESSLDYVDLPIYLISIGAYAFAGCNLGAVNIGSRVTDIGEGAFIECTSLTSAYFSGNAPAMGKDVFDGCGYYYYDDEDYGFTVYYFEGKTGFTDPWYGYHTESMTPYIRIIDIMDFSFYHKLGPWDFYRKVTSHLVFDTNITVVSAEWKSDNKNVVISNAGTITNKGVGARKANITLTVTDADGVKYSKTVRVVFYKYDWELKYFLK